MKPGKPKPVPAAQLSDLEIRAALAVRKFDPEKKQGWVDLLERIGADDERKAAAARRALALRLVSGGAR